MKRLAWVLLLAPLTAWAGTATLTWTNPTTRTDGVALTPTEIAGTRVEWSACTSTGTFGTVAGQQSVAGTATTMTVLNLAAGNWCFRAYTRDTAGLESVASAVASKIVPSTAAPRPPTLVTVATTAYEARFDGRQYVAGRAVGTVSLGQPCANEQPIALGFGAVDRSLVRLTKMPKSSLLLARCA